LRKITTQEWSHPVDFSGRLDRGELAIGPVLPAVAAVVAGKVCALPGQVGMLTF
jgi:hypothetical protein